MRQTTIKYKSLLERDGFIGPERRTRCCYISAQYFMVLEVFLAEIRKLEMKVFGFHILAVPIVDHQGKT